MNLLAGIVLSLLLSVQVLGLGAAPAAAAPKAEPWSFWAASDPMGNVRVDHVSWDQFLKKYVVTNRPSGINRVRYASVTPEDRKALAAYLERLQQVEVTRLPRDEQKAYWINLYNALTVSVVLTHYPVKSIRDINISPGIFTRGPWGAKSLTIQGQKVSLNDIEHRILRPQGKDNRVHYAVNCASLGCPNLQPVAYTPGNTKTILEKGTREYVNHERGARWEGNRLYLSSIYDWFQADFGDSEEGVILHLLQYAEPELAKKLKNFHGEISYDYDWRINDP
ncbi:MAG: DUF547 domain-containing protein [Deltaproteobacteria bacterium]|nr:DUF547 domain-containing protein [Deltaproteobacteria bacterium]